MDFRDWLRPIHCQLCLNIIDMSLPPGKYWHFKCILRRLAIINGEV